MKTIHSHSYKTIVAETSNNEYVLTDLPYAYDALEPIIDIETMKLHHDKHHATYLENLLNEIKGTKLEKVNPYDLICDLSQVPQKKLAKVQNNLGGFINHNMFFAMMRKPTKGNKPESATSVMINDSFGSFDTFKKEFVEAAKNHFGSGWIWLCVKKNKLKIETTKNQDNPLMGREFAEAEGTPILGLDVWEHAYYLKYQNKRADYVEAWFDVIDWSEVERILTTKKAEKSASRKNSLLGGKGDKAKESDFDPQELAKGIKTELEHTIHKEIAREIAMDHLTEDPKYYTKLLRAGL